MRILTKLNKLFAILLLAAILFIPFSQVVGAQAPTPTPPPNPPPPVSLPAPGLHGLFGVVKAVAPTALTLEGSPIEGATAAYQVAVSSQTRIMAPPIQVASIGYIKIGDRLAILASVSEGIYTALQIVVIPRQPVKRHIQGLVMDVKDNQIILINRAGKVFVLQLAPNVPAPPLGQFIISTVEEDFALQPAFFGRLLVYEVSEKLLKRLGNHIANRVNQVQRLAHFVGADLAAGQAAYESFCSGCHGKDAASLKKEMPKPQDIWKAVRKGEIKDGMPAFSASQVSDAALANITGYLNSIGAVKMPGSGNDKK